MLRPSGTKGGGRGIVKLQIIQKEKKWRSGPEERVKTKPHPLVLR